MPFVEEWQEAVSRLDVTFESVVFGISMGIHYPPSCGQQ
jgi:hypothetical protein